MKPPVPLSIVQGMMREYDPEWSVRFDRLETEEPDGSTITVWAYIFIWEGVKLADPGQTPVALLWADECASRVDAAVFCCSVAALGPEDLFADADEA